MQIQRVVVWSFHRAIDISKREIWRDQSTSKANERRQISRDLSRLVVELNAIATEVRSKDSPLLSTYKATPPGAPLVALVSETAAYHLHEAAQHVNTARRIVDNFKERQNPGKRGEKRSKAIEKELVECLAEGWQHLSIPVQAYLHGKESKTRKGPTYGGAFVEFCEGIRQAIRSIGGVELSNLSRLAVSISKNDRKQKNTK